MSKKDLFKIILKFYGLYSIIGVLVELPYIIYSLRYASIHEIDWMIFTVPVTGLFIVYLLLFKPEMIIKLFRLGDGFDNKESTSTGISENGIIKIGLIIIAIYLIASNLGGFISQVIFSFKESVSRNNLDTLLETFDPNPVNYQIMIETGICLMVGFLLLTNHTRITNWVGKINNKNVG